MRIPGSKYWLQSIFPLLLLLLLIVPDFTLAQKEIKVISPEALIMEMDSTEMPIDSALKESHYFTLNVGVYNFLRGESIEGLFEGEFYPSWKLWIFHLYAGFFVSTNTSSLIYAGITLPIPFLKHYLFRISFAPGYFASQDEKCELGYPLEFKTSLRFSIQFKNKNRLSLEFSHISNAGLSEKNLGSETLVVSYEIPFNRCK